MRFATRLLAKNDDGGSGNPDPTMNDIPKKKSDAETVPPAGGEAMAPVDSDQPHAKPDDAASEKSSNK